MTRRVVTGHKDGKGMVLFDGPAPNRKLRQASGLASTLLWVTDESPADISGRRTRPRRGAGSALRRTLCAGGRQANRGGAGRASSGRNRAPGELGRGVADGGRRDPSTAFRRPARMKDSGPNPHFS